MLRKGKPTRNEVFKGKHCFEHWYRDNTVYFLTVRCTNKVHAFASDEAKQIFWRQFDRYVGEHEFEPFVCTLLDNHYHALGYLAKGDNLPLMLRKIHGSIAKLVNDILPNRLLPFWAKYFDGCLRDENQYRRAYRYTQIQSQRHGVVSDWRTYSHTHTLVNLEDGLAQALRMKAFLPDVPYQRYSGRRT